MTILHIIIAIYILGVFFNFGIVFVENVIKKFTIKDNCKFIALSFLSWLLFPIAYIYQAIVQKLGRKN